MKRKNLVLVPLLFTFIIFTLLNPVFAAWYTHNEDVEFNLNKPNNKWQEDDWNPDEGYAFVGYGMGNVKRDSDEWYEWGNQELCQGDCPDPEYWGYFDPFSADSDYRVKTYAKRTSKGGYWYSWQCVSYIELWGYSEEEIGDDNLHWIELLYCVDVEADLWSYQGENTYTTDVVGSKCYRCIYRNYDIGTSWTYKEINMRNLADELAEEYNIDLSDVEIQAVCVGVEGANGYMGYQFAYVYVDSSEA